MFLGPYYPPLEPQDWKPNQGDLYKQYINEVGGFRAWIYHDSEWIEYADMSDVTFDIGWPDVPAEDPDVYWSGPTKWIMTSGEWVLATQNIKPPPTPDPITGPIAPELPDNPDDGDTWTDPITGDVWYWWDDRWQTKPAPGEGGGITEVYTYDVNVDESEKIALTDVLRVIPDLDLSQLNNQKDVNWAISNALDALDTQVDQNSGRLDDLTLLVPGARYLYEPASTYPRPPQTGKFYLGNGFTFTDVFGDVTQIMIHHHDNTGTEHTLENVNIGDSIIIEHDLDAQNFGRYLVSEVFHNFDDSIITVEVVSHRGSVEVDQTYDVLAFPDVNVSDKPSYDYVDQGLDTKVNRTGDTMTGKLTTQDLEVRGGLLLNSPTRNINAEFGTAGKLQYAGDTRLAWGYNNVNVKGELNIADGLDYVGTPITGQINMDNKFIKNLANPTDSQHAATKYYVDAQVKTWPGRRFKFKGYGQVGSALGPGYWSPTSNNISSNINMSVEDIDGLRINQGSPDYVPGVSLTMTVYTLENEIWTAVGFGVYGGTQTDFRADHIRLTGFEWKQKPNLTNNTTYALHLGSMW